MASALEMDANVSGGLSAASGLERPDAPSAESGGERLDQALEALDSARDLLTQAGASGQGAGPARRCPVDAAPLNGRFTPRELDVWRLVAAGHRSKAIAAILHISTRTVECHRQRLYGKLGVDNMAPLVVAAIRHGLVPCPRARTAESPYSDR